MVHLGKGLALNARAGDLGMKFIVIYSLKVTLDQYYAACVDGEESVGVSRSVVELDLGAVGNVGGGQLAVVLVVSVCKN